MRFKFSILYLILAILIIVSGSAFFIGYYLYQDTLRESLEAREEEKAHDITYYVNSMIGNMINDIKTLSDILKKDHVLLRDIVQYQLDGNQKPLKKFIEHLYPNLARMEVGLFIVTDNRGKIVYQSHNPQSRGQVYQTWGLEEALSGEDILASGYGPQGWAIRTLTPLSLGAKQYGVLILGIYLNDEFARKIAAATHTHISFSTPYKILASSWPRPEQQKVGLPWVVRSLHEKRPFFTIDAGAKTSSYHVPIDIGDETVCLVVNTDTSPIYNLLAQKKRHLFLSFFGVLLGILGLGSGLAVTIVGPLRDLKQRSLEMIKEFSQKEVALKRGGNEIDTLSQAMELMLAAIRTHLAELHQTQETLKEREAFWSNVFACIQDGVTVIDRNFTILRVNATMNQRVPGDQPQVGQKCYAVLHGRSQPCPGCPCQQAIETGEVGYQCKLYAGGKKPIWVELFAFPLRDLDSGEVTGVIEYSRDITERKQAEGELEQSISLLQATLESTADGLLVVDRDGKIVTYNQKFAQMWRIPETILASWDDDRALDSALEQLVDPDGFLSKVRELYGQPEAEGYDLLEFKDGRVFERYSQPQRIGQAIVGRVWSFRDVTQRRQAEEALSKNHRELQETAQRLEQSRNMLQLILESIPVRVFWKDKNLCYLGCNTLFARDAGLSRPEQLLGLDDFAMGWREQAELYQADDRRIMESGLPKVNIIEPQTTPEGGKIWLNTSKVPLRTPNGEVLGVLGVYQDITARKQAEAALAEETIRRRILVEQSRDGIVVLDETGKVYEANQRYGEMLGYSTVEIRQLYVWDWDANWTREELLEMIHTVDEAGDHFETRHRRKDGTIFDVEISTNGAVLGGQKLVFCVCRDISQRKAAERALRESEEKYRDLVNQIPAVVFRGYADWSIDTFDRKIETLTGYSKEDFDSRRRKWSDVILKDDLPEMKAKFLEGLKTGGTYEREYRIRQKSGRIIWVQVQGRIFLDDAGRIDYISGVIFDVTGRKRMEEELRKERDLSVSIMESLPGVFYLFDEQGRLIRWNKNMEEISGYSALEIFQLRPPDFFTTQDKARVATAIQAVFDTGEARIEAELVSKDGNKTPYLFTGRRIVLEDRLFLVGMGLDISQRRQMEEALKKRLVALSRPLDDAGDINFEDLFNLEEIQQIQDLFAQITGVASLITTPDGTPLTRPSSFCRLCRDIVRQTEEGNKRCQDSDAKMGRLSIDAANVQHCLSAGLCNAGASISVGGKHIANWMIGQVRDETETEEWAREYARKIGIDEEEFLAAFLEVPVMPKEQFEQVAHALFVFANQLSAMAYQNVQQARFITERQRAEEALKESEQRFRDIVDNAREWIWEADAQGKYTYSNSLVEKLLGYSPEEIINQKFYELFHPDDREELKQKAFEVFATKEPFREFINRNVHKNGQEVWLSTSGVPILDDNGNLIGYRGADTDITERLRAEKALKESETRFRDIADNAREWIWELDAAGRFTYSSSTVEKLLGYKPEEIMNKYFYDFFHPEDREELTKASLERILAKIPPQNFIHRTVHKNGQTVWLSTNGVILLDDQGNVKGLRGAHTDITERLEAEKALKESERFLSSVFASIQDSITILDKDLNILRVNPAREQAFAQEMPLVGKKCYEVLHHIDQPCEGCTALRTIETGQPTRKIMTFELGGWEGLKYINLSTFPLIDSSGQITGVVEVGRDITEQKQAEEAVRERESMLSLVINTVPQVIFWKDLKSVYLGCNQNCARAVGLEKPEMIVGKTEYDLPWEQEEIENYLAEDRRVMQTRQGEYHKVKTIPLADGRQVWVDATKIPLLAGDGTVMGVLGVFNDITESKRMEEELRESEASYRTLAQNLPGLVYRVFLRENFRMEFYNEALQSMTGYTPQELGQMEFCSLDPFILSADREKMNQAIKEAIARDQAFEVEYRFRHKDGSIRYFAERGKPIPGEDGRVTHIDGVIWDITEAKQLEAAIQESERRFRGLVENVPMGIMIVQDGHVVYQNPEQERLFGHLQIQNCHDLAICAHPDDLAKAKQFCYGIMTNQPQADITLRFVPLGSSPLETRITWVNCRAAVTEYRGQKGMLINMVDITHTKELEHLMLIREKMASLGQVAAGIAHEIRNPLSGINVFLDGIKENFQNPESTPIVKELIEAAQATSNRIEAVIRRVLDFSRPTELHLAPTDANLAVDNAIKLTTTSLRKEDIKIESNLAGDLPLVKADLQLLEQVLVNIINNAGEALRGYEKPGQIQVVTQKAPEGVWITVKDSGPGIPPEIRDKIFDPFFTTKSDGSGIGLSLCHRIIADHGGTIQVSSSDLGGTQFIINLPQEIRGPQP